MKQFSLEQTRQSGAALIVCLLLLLVMTLLGVNAVMTTTMEEKMAGNSRNKQLSFQAAETALREGEAIAANLDPTTTFNGTDGLYDRWDPDTNSTPLWEQSGINWQAATKVKGVVSAPEYIIEDFSDAPRDKNCMLELPPPPGCMLPIYRVTARGTGQNDTARTVLQSTYKQL